MNTRGTIFDGEFLDDKKNGIGIYFFEDGTKLKGQYKNNKKVGTFEFQQINGEIEFKVFN